MTEAQKYLLRVYDYESKINCKLEEIDRLNSTALKMTASLSGEVVSGSKNQDKVGDAVSRIVDLQREINHETDAFIDARNEVAELLSRVSNTKQFNVLYKRYILFKPWEQIACEMGYTYRNVCYIHGRALQAVERIMKLKEEQGNV